MIAWRKRVDGISQNDFALLIGSKPTTFLDYLRPKGQSKIRLDLLNNIVSSFPQVNREWLFWGEGEMLVAEETRHASSQALDTQAATIRDALLAVSYTHLAYGHNFGMSGWVIEWDNPVHALANNFSILHNDCAKRPTAQPHAFFGKLDCSFHETFVFHWNPLLKSDSIKFT